MQYSTKYIEGLSGTEFFILFPCISLVEMRVLRNSGLSCGLFQNLGTWFGLNQLLSTFVLIASIVLQRHELDIIVYFHSSLDRLSAIE